MQIRTLLAAFAGLLIVSCQQPAPPPPPAPDIAAVETIRQAWSEVAENIALAAEQVPEENYDFRPAEEVRSFGELIGHLAGAQDLFCGTVLQEETGGEDAVEESATTKADLVSALRASNDHCGTAYGLSDAEASTRMVTLFGQEQTALAALLGNAMHDESHYGNIVTYLRILEMVPPSSQGQ